MTEHDLMTWEEFMERMRSTSQAQRNSNEITIQQFKDENSLFNLVDASLTETGKERDQPIGIWWLIMQGIIREHWEEERKLHGKCECDRCKPK